MSGANCLLHIISLSHHSSSSPRLMFNPRYFYCIYRKHFLRKMWNTIREFLIKSTGRKIYQHYSCQLFSCFLVRRMKDIKLIKNFEHNYFSNEQAIGVFESHFPDINSFNYFFACIFGVCEQELRLYARPRLSWSSTSPSVAIFHHLAQPTKHHNLK